MIHIFNNLANVNATVEILLLESHAPHVQHHGHHRLMSKVCVAYVMEVTLITAFTYLIRVVHIKESSLIPSIKQFITDINNIHHQTLVNPHLPY